MTAEKPQSVEMNDAISPNWPRDVHSTLSALRRELARAVGRVKGSTERQEVFEAHLKEAILWSRKRFAIQEGIKQRAFERAVQRNNELDEQTAAAEAMIESGELVQETAGERATRQANAGVGAPVAGGVSSTRG